MSTRKKGFVRLERINFFPAKLGWWKTFLFLLFREPVSRFKFNNSLNALLGKVHNGVKRYIWKEEYYVVDSNNTVYKYKSKIQQLEELDKLWKILDWAYNDCLVLGKKGNYALNHSFLIYNIHPKTILINLLGGVLLNNYKLPNGYNALNLAELGNYVELNNRKALIKLEFILHSLTNVDINSAFIELYSKHAPIDYNSSFGRRIMLTESISELKQMIIFLKCNNL